MSIRLLLMIAAAGTLVGCARTAEYLRTQPVTHFQPALLIPVPQALTNWIVVRCMKESDVADTVQDKVQKQCLYVSVDVGKLTNTLDKVDETVLRDKTISYLMSVSDMNCSNFLHRAFANKAGLDFSRGFFNDLATGVSAGSAHANPALSATLGIGNLIVGKGVESFNSTYYFDKTYQALESAVTAERIKIKTLITARQAQSITKDGVFKYEIVQALSDIRAYDDACSIKAGLAQLVQLADAKKEVETKNKVKVEFSSTPVATALKLYGDQAVGAEKP